MAPSAGNSNLQGKLGLEIILRKKKHLPSHICQKLVPIVRTVLQSLHTMHETARSHPYIPIKNVWNPTNTASLTRLSVYTALNFFSRSENSSSVHATGKCFEMALGLKKQVWLMSRHNMEEKMPFFRGGPLPTHLSTNSLHWNMLAKKHKKENKPNKDKEKQHKII